MRITRQMQEVGEKITNLLLDVEEGMVALLLVLEAEEKTKQEGREGKRRQSKARRTQREETRWAESRIKQR
jgi:hypothetical protein